MVCHSKSWARVILWLHVGYLSIVLGGIKLQGSSLSMLTVKLGLNVSCTSPMVQGGRDVHKGGVYGFQTGEGPSAGTAVTHKVRINNRFANQVVEVEVPEDR